MRTGDWDSFTVSSPPSRRHLCYFRTIPHGRVFRLVSAWFTPCSLIHNLSLVLYHVYMCAMTPPQKKNSALEHKNKVQINEVYGGRYRVRKKLGWGHFSTVWMVDDLTKIGADGVTEELASDGSGRPKLLALKVQKSAEHYTEAALDEVRVGVRERHAYQQEKSRRMHS